ncbi:MAG: heme NO-binding domain-containing protein [Actinomycetota bacterium]
MKGVIFNVVEEVVTELYDEDTWDALLESAGVDGAYAALGNYPDEELIGIVVAGVEATGIEADTLVRVIGQHALKGLIERMPDSVEGAEDTFTFLRRVNDIIHPEVLKLYPQATPPAFTFHDHAEGMVVHYRSGRNLPALAAGLIEGCADVFDQDVAVEILDDEVGPDTTALLVRVS